jgi:hypothetical protein
VRVREASEPPPALEDFWVGHRTKDLLRGLDVEPRGELGGGVPRTPRLIFGSRIRSVVCAAFGSLGRSSPAAGAGGTWPHGKSGDPLSSHLSPSVLRTYFSEQPAERR